MLPFKHDFTISVLLHFQVTIGVNSNLVFQIGYLRYGKTLWDYTPAQYGIIGGAIVLLVVIIIVTGICCVCCCSRKNDNKTKKSEENEAYLEPDK